MSVLRSCVSVAALSLGSVVVVAPPAMALSCVGAETVLADADLVFTGRIVDSAGGRLLVATEQVWRGGPVEEQVWLGVELPDWSAWADRNGGIPEGYASPRTWVFAPEDATVNPCTAWPAKSAQLHGLEPETTTEPIADESTDDQSSEPAPPPTGSGWSTEAGAGVVGGACALMAGAVLLRRRGRR